MTRALRHSHDHSGDAVRITTAAASRDDDISARQRRYLWSMGIRTLCVIGAVIVGSGWLLWVLIAGAVVLPYVAVVMANAAGSRSDDFTIVPPGTTHPELPGPPE